MVICIKLCLSLEIPKAAQFIGACLRRLDER